MALVPQSCPSCASPLAVTQLTCTSCGTGVVGKFELSPFFRLKPESLKFLEVFVRNRGVVVPSTQCFLDQPASSRAHFGLLHWS